MKLLVLVQLALVQLVSLTVASSDPCSDISKERKCKDNCFWNSASDSCQLINKCNGASSYSIVFNAQWNSENHPRRYPSSAHWSRLIGASFGYGDEYWQLNEKSTQGMKNMAEFGGTSTLVQELKSNADKYLDVQTARSGIGRGTGEMSLSLEVDGDHDRVGLVTMIAPSPDWFSGVSAAELCDYQTGEWKQNVELDLYAYDAGTDKGKYFDSENRPRSNYKDIKRIKCGKGVFCRGQSTPFKPIAKAAFTLTQPGL